MTLSRRKKNIFKAIFTDLFYVKRRTGFSSETLQFVDCRPKSSINDIVSFINWNIKNSRKRQLSIHNSLVQGLLISFPIAMLPMRLNRQQHQKKNFLHPSMARYHKRNKNSSFDDER